MTVCLCHGACVSSVSVAHGPGPRRCPCLCPGLRTGATIRLLLALDVVCNFPSVNTMKLKPLKCTTFAEDEEVDVEISVCLPVSACVCSRVAVCVCVCLPMRVCPVCVLRVLVSGPGLRCSLHCRT